jgi:beta-galactosidase
MITNRALRNVAYLLCFWASTVLYGSESRPRIDLDGVWQFRMDPQGAGEADGWHSEGVSFSDTIRVPGCWQAQGFGKPSGIQRNHYAGSAWYRRSVAVPADWKGKSVLLTVGGVVRRATIFVNGKQVGVHDGFSTPFSLDVTSVLRPGGENTIAFLVSNPGSPITESPDVQKASEPTGMLNYIGNWGGIYGSVALEASDPARIEDIAVSPDIQSSRAHFRISVRDSAMGGPYEARVEVAVDGRTASNPIRVEAGGSAETEVVVDMADAVLWTPDTPHLYTATVRLVQDEHERDRIEQRFGMRAITTRGNVLLLNGRPLYLRGYGDDNVEVLTGVPPASKEIFLNRIRRAKEFGFNAVRFHSMVPMREFFEAADEAGLFILAELPAAYTMYVLPHREFLRQELEQVLRVHRNHPSFLSLAFGNEFNLGWLKTAQEKREFQALMEDLYKLGKSIDPNRLILSNDGLLLRPTDMASVFDAPPQDLPAIRHEFGEYYCSLPDISLIKRFTGVIVPQWLYEKTKWVEEHQLSDLYGTFVLNSQRLQQLGRKFQIERTRRLQEFTGYEYWLITDYPGGTGEGDSWEEGWFNYFWEPKGISPRDGLDLNTDTLLMIGTGVSDRTMWTGSSKRISVSVSNYGDGGIESGTLSWSLLREGKPIAGSEITGIRAPLGKVSRIAEISLGPVVADEAEKLELVVELKGSKSTHKNRWDFWVFPRQQLIRSPDAQVTSNVKWEGLRRLYPFIVDGNGMPERGLLITSTLDAETVTFLESGGRVWLMAGEAQFGHKGDATFFPASGGALGTAIQSHPALRGYPHDGFCDLQFFNLLEGAWNFPLDAWPKELTPIAGGIRTRSSFLSKQKSLSRVGYIFETKVGKGSLLVTTLSLREHFDEAYPEAIYLFDRLLRYATGPKFQPRVQVCGAVLDRLLAH